jgi:ribosome biogenesis protein MAK21
MKENPSLKSLINQPEEDDEEEHFTDVDRISDTASNVSEKQPSTTSSSHYDGRKRDPRYANAEKSCLWELTLLAKHYHPSVTHHVMCLLKGEPIEELPQLHLYTLTHFLDKFVYRNPKKRSTEVARGISIMQPAERDALSAGQFVWQRQSGLAPGEVAVNSEAFLKLSKDQIKADELFFHRFFTARQEKEEKREKKKKRKRSKYDEDSELDESDVEAALLGKGEEAESDLSDEEAFEAAMQSDEDMAANAEEPGLSSDEDEVWSAMQRHMPKELRQGLDEMDSDVDDEEFAKYMQEDEEDEDQMMDEEEDEDADDADAELVTLWNEDDASDASSDSEPRSRSGKKASKGKYTYISSKLQLTHTIHSDQGRAKKRRREMLPTFASFDDYAAMIERDEAEHGFD